MTTRAKGNEQLVEMDTVNDKDEHEEEATSEDERAKVKWREDKRITLHAIPQLEITLSVRPQPHVTPLSHIWVLCEHLACYRHIIRLYSVI